LSEHAKNGARPRVLILGGGFAGIGAAQKLAKSDVDVVLVDKHDYHTFQPLLYQVATGLLEQPAVGHPIRDLFDKQQNVRVHQDEVTAVDLDARRAAADDDDVERAVLDDARVAVGRLPALEQVVLQMDRVRQRVHRERVLGRAVRAEEVHLRAEAQHEIVVVQRVEVVERDAARVEVDPRRRRLVHRRVVLVLQEVPERMPHRGRLEQARRELVEERLERVVVVPVDEDDVGLRLLELLRRADAREPTAKDHDTAHPAPP